jgi:hypothetical protein
MAYTPPLRENAPEPLADRQFGNPEPEQVDAAEQERLDRLNPDAPGTLGARHAPAKPFQYYAHGPQDPRVEDGEGGEHGERRRIDPSRRVILALEAVKRLYDDLVPLADKHAFVIGPLIHFGLGFDVFDPISGLVMTAARPHRTDVGEEPILLTAAGVVHAIIAARRHQAARA